MFGVSYTSRAIPRFAASAKAAYLPFPRQPYRDSCTRHWKTKRARGKCLGDSWMGTSPDLTLTFSRGGIALGDADMASGEGSMGHAVDNTSIGVPESKAAHRLERALWCRTTG